MPGRYPAVCFASGRMFVCLPRGASLWCRLPDTVESVSRFRYSCHIKEPMEE
jgi:hypothetical protein